MNKAEDPDENERLIFDPGGNETTEIAIVMLALAVIAGLAIAAVLSA